MLNKWKASEAVAAISAALILFASPSHAGTLFIASDFEDFAGLTDATGAPLDHLGVWDVTGAVVNSSTIIDTSFYLNGLADAGGKLLTGTPGANTLRTVGFDGSLISTLVAPGIPNSGCCNEELLFVPQTSGPDKVYAAHFSDVIREIDPTTGNEVASFDQTDVVGMALVGTDIWISKWDGQSVGIWDPGSNTYTPMFSTPANAGGLAFDPLDDIMWVGMQGGSVTPYSLTGTVLGDSFKPFGDIEDTIDGLTFLGEVTQTPEPATLALLGLGLVGLGLMRRKRAA